MLAPAERIPDLQPSLFSLLSLFAVSAVVGGGLLATLKLLLPANFANASINHRSNHKQPARQIGGLAIVPASLAILIALGPHFGMDTRFIISTTVAVLILLVTGYIDDRSNLTVGPRIVAQLLACSVSVYGLGPNFHLISTVIPRVVEIPLLIIALMWFINLTNFMDGLDLMVVSGLGIPLAAIMLFATAGLADSATGALAAILVGALAGFGLFNTPPARIFLGDAGSIPLGIMAGICFFKVALDTHLTVGFMLPLYFSADASITVLMRLFAGESIFTSHSRHAYQVARRKGWSVKRVIAWVAVLNVFIALCALAGALTQGVLVTDIAFTIASAALAYVLWRFRRSEPPVATGA